MLRRDPTRIPPFDYAEPVAAVDAETGYQVKLRSAADARCLRCMVSVLDVSVRVL
jgi:hypothetical protein